MPDLVAYGTFACNLQDSSLRSALSVRIPSAVTVLFGKSSQLLGLGSIVIDLSSCSPACPADSVEITESMPKENLFMARAKIRSAVNKTFICGRVG